MISCSGSKWYLTAGIIWFIACAGIVIGLPFMELAGRVVFFTNISSWIDKRAVFFAFL